MLAAASVAGILLGIGINLGYAICQDMEVSIWRSVVTSPVPEQCTLCSGMTYHAPCLLDLSTGRLVELEIYERDPVRGGEIANTQSLDHCVMRLGGAGLALFITRNAEVQECAAWLSVKNDEIDPAYFCRDCRALLTEVSIQGSVLLDLYSRDAIHAYTVEDGANYTIRDYTVSIVKNEKDHLTITATGHAFDS